MSRFLTFLVDRHLEGRDEELKESLIAHEVFGRRPDYDPKQDSIVRTEAARLRARLAEHYAGAGAPFDRDRAGSEGRLRSAPSVPGGADRRRGPAGDREPWTGAGAARCGSLPDDRARWRAMVVASRPTHVDSDRGAAAHESWPRPGRRSVRGRPDRRARQESIGHRRS